MSPLASSSSFRFELNENGYVRFYLGDHVREYHGGAISENRKKIQLLPMRNYFSPEMITPEFIHAFVSNVRNNVSDYFILAKSLFGEAHETFEYDAVEDVFKLHVRNHNGCGFCGEYVIGHDVEARNIVCCQLMVFLELLNQIKKRKLDALLLLL